MLMNNLQRLGLEDESVLHWDESMLEDNFLFEDRVMFRDDGVGTSINLKHFDVSDAFHFTLYDGELLSPIQALRIMSDVVSLYQNNSKEEFIEMIDELSISTMTSQTQSSKKHKEDIREWIIKPFLMIMQK